MSKVLFDRVMLTNGTIIAIMPTHDTTATVTAPNGWRISQDSISAFLPMGAWA